MKKLLSILAALGLTATASTSVVACGSAKRNAPKPKPSYPKDPMTFDEGQTIKCNSAYDFFNDDVWAEIETKENAHDVFKQYINKEVKITFDNEKSGIKNARMGAPLSTSNKNYEPAVVNNVILGDSVSGKATIDAYFDFKHVDFGDAFKNGKSADLYINIYDPLDSSKIVAKDYKIEFILQESEDKLDYGENDWGRLADSCSPNNFTMLDYEFGVYPNETGPDAEPKYDSRYLGNVYDDLQKDVIPYGYKMQINDFNLGDIYDPLNFGTAELRLKMFYSFFNFEYSVHNDVLKTFSTIKVDKNMDYASDTNAFNMWHWYLSDYINKNQVPNSESFVTTMVTLKTSFVNDNDPKDKHDIDFNFNLNFALSSFGINR